MMSFALCYKCGHEGSLDEFKVVAEDGVNIHAMPLREALAHDLKFECPKCAGTECGVSAWPRSKK